MASICVFCGSRPGISPVHRAAARSLGLFLAANGHTLIYGGGSVGMMGELADACLEVGGRVIGVIPEHLARVELMHAGVHDMRVTGDMHHRKASMHQLADAYVTLPGGFGTLEELFEAATWAQLELHARPIAVLNQNGLYDGLLSTLEQMIAEDFLSVACRRLLTVVDTVDQLTSWIQTHFPVPCSEVQH